MKHFRALMVRIAGLFRRSRLEAGMAEELDSHFAMHVSDNLRAGMSPEEARRQANLYFGGVESAKEAYRDRGSLPWVEHIWRDAAFAARQLLKNPGFAITAIAILALGIGATTAIFSVVNPILFESLPYPDAKRIVTVSDFANGGGRLAVTFGTYAEIRQRNRSFESLAAMKVWLPTLTGQEHPERFTGQRVSADYFRVLGVLPILGRNFESGDDKYRGPNVVIVSYSLWQSRFGADRNIVGHEIRLDDNVYTVIGVMPNGFENVTAPSAEIWAPLQYDPALLPDSREWGHHLGMFGRLKPGITLAQARNDLNSIARNPIHEFSRPPHAALPSGLFLNSLQDDVTQSVKPALVAILGAVVLLLVIACVNVTNLLLARGVQRGGELAMRSALGASRGRILQQLLTESVLLGLLGGALGFLIANAGVEGLVALRPAELPRAGVVAVNGTALLFATALSVLIGCVVGIIPALHISGTRSIGELQQVSSHATAGHRLVRRSLVVAEISLALVLLVGSGLLLRSLQKLFAVEPGFDPSHTIAMQIQTAGSQFNDQKHTEQYFKDVIRATRSVPGVVQAGFTSQLPLSGDPDDMYGVHFESSPTGKPDADSGALRYAVSNGYIEAMGIALLRGRLLDSHDHAGTTPVALISESLAKSKFQDGDPLGQRLQIGPANSPMYTVVGVVGDVKQASLALNQPDAVYIPSDQWTMFGDRTRWLAVRTKGDPSAVIANVKSAAWSVDKDQPIVRVSTMQTLLTTSAAERRFALVLFEAFAVVALLLAATGIYGVLSGGVTERTREIGIRVALGASRGNIVSLIVRQGLTMTSIGLVLGLAGAAIASQALISLLFGVSHLDPTTYLGVILLLMAASLIACWLPASRAARVDPAITLRSE